MTLQQLRYFCEIAAQNWNISKASKALHTSQPGMSRQMHALEEELGITIFSRHKNRVTGVTAPGAVALSIAQRMLDDSANLKLLQNQFDETSGGSLTIAATHTQARHVLPAVIELFTRTRPNVELFLKQGVPTELARLVDRGEADLSVSTMPPSFPDDVAMLPCFTVDRIALVPVGHPLAGAASLTLEQIAKFPLITYDSTFMGRSSVIDTFKRAGLSPKVAISAVDTDVMKAYAAQGLGVAIMSTLAFDPTTDLNLRALSVSDLFGADTIYLGLRRFTHLRRLVREFIAIYAPNLTAADIDKALNDD
jgi:LysR family cys regulon transcriptional activator